MTGVLARLEADGWIARRVNPDDGRSMTIASTGRIADLDSAYATDDQVVEEDEKNAEFAALIADTTRRLRAFNRFDSNR